MIFSEVDGRWKIIPLSQSPRCIWLHHHLCETPAWANSTTQKESLSACQPCFQVFTPEPNCLTFVPDRSVWAWWYFEDEKSTEERCVAKMWEGSRWGSLWLIFPLATWQGGDRALIMNCDTLMSLSSTDNTWSALLPFNLWYQCGKLQTNKGFISLAKSEHDFKTTPDTRLNGRGFWWN